MKLKILILIICVSCKLTAQNQSFEDSAPNNWKVSKGPLTISNKHYKHDLKSLQWDWTANNVITVTNLQAKRLRPIDVITDPKIFRFFMYNTSIINAAPITIEFYDENNTQQYYYTMTMNFTGWVKALWLIKIIWRV